MLRRPVPDLRSLSDPFAPMDAEPHQGPNVVGCFCNRVRKRQDALEHCVWREAQVVGADWKLTQDGQPESPEEPEFSTWEEALGGGGQRRLEACAC